MLLTLLVGVATACDINTLERAVTAAESAWWVDEAAFYREAALVKRTVGCLEDRVTPSLAARVHGVMGLDLRSGHGDPEKVSEEYARLSFAAARANDEAWTLPSSVPPDSPLRDEAEAVPLRWSGLMQVPVPPRGTIMVFDGVENELRQAAWPTIYQLEGEGVVLQSAWLLPDQPLPPFPEAERTRRPGPLALGGASLGLAVAGGALVGLGELRFRTLGGPTVGGGRYVVDLERYEREVVPLYAAGGGLLAVGGLGLATSGGWLWMSSRGAGVGGRF